MSKDVDLFYGVGLVPIPGIGASREEDKIETKGLQWNLGVKYGLKKLDWGSTISTSNQIKNEKYQVSIKSYKVPLIFSTSLKYGEIDDEEWKFIKIIINLMQKYFGKFIL